MHNQTTRLILFILAGLLLSRSQANIFPGQLWQAQYLEDQYSGRQDRHVQSYLQMGEDQRIRILFFEEFFEKENGRPHIIQHWEFLHIQKLDSSRQQFLIDPKGKKAFELEVLADTLLRLSDQSFHFVYQLLPEKPLNIQKATLMNLIVGQDFEVIRNAYNIAEEEKICFLDTERMLPWRIPADKERLYFDDFFPLYSPFKLIQMDGYLIFKGITAFPLLVREVGPDHILFVEYNTREQKRSLVKWKRIIQ